MATTTEYLQGTIATVLSTEMNSQANNVLVLGAAYDNSSLQKIMAEVELRVDFGGSTPILNTGASIWFLRDIDGTNYEDGAVGVLPARLPDVVIPFRNASGVQRCTRRCVIPPGTFKVLLKNDGSGAAFAATLNTLKILPLTYQSV